MKSLLIHLLLLTPLLHAKVVKPRGRVAGGYERRPSTVDPLTKQKQVVERITLQVQLSTVEYQHQLKESLGAMCQARGIRQRRSKRAVAVARLAVAYTAWSSSQKAIRTHKDENENPEDEMHQMDASQLRDFEQLVNSLFETTSGRIGRPVLLLPKFFNKAELAIDLEKNPEELFRMKYVPVYCEGDSSVAVDVFYEQ